MKFVIFHGAFGSPDDNWFPQLKEKLENLGHRAVVPQFPVDNWEEVTASGSNVLPRKQNLTNWLTVFEKEVLPQIKKTDKLCFIGHSISCVFILHVVAKHNLKLDSAIFVSPFMDFLKHKKLWQFDHVNRTFYRTDFDFVKLKKLIPVSYVLYSNSDPYVDSKSPAAFAQKMGSRIAEVKNGGHLSDPKYADLIFMRIRTWRGL